VVVENVYVGSTPGGAEFSRWYCTPRGKLTITDAAATASFNVKYRWWAEEGETGSSNGIVMQRGGFFNWSIDNTCDTVETTDFDDAGVKTYKATLTGWTAAAERHWITGEGIGLKGKMGSGVAMIVKFYVENIDTDKGIGSTSDTGTRYEGYAHLTGLSPSTAVDTLTNESLTFQGTGRLTYEAGS